MRKFLCILAALILAVLPVTSLAEMTIVSQRTLERIPTINPATGTYISRAAEGGQALFDRDGNALTPGYASMSTKENGLFLEVINEDVINCAGLLDANGKELLPLAYGDIIFGNKNWILGVVLESTDDVNGDYRDFSGNQYNIASTDVYYQGAKIATLTRDECNNYGRVNGAGDYMSVRLDDGSGFWLTKAGERLDYDADHFNAYEFYDDYKNGVIHCPTGQQAFVAGCTLTADEVDQPIWYDRNGNFVDLQGNVIAAAAQPYDSFRYDGGDYGVVTLERKRGLVDLNGNEVIPPIYDELSAAYNDGETLANGVQAVIKDGTLSYIDKNGNVLQTLSDATLTSSDCNGFTYNSRFMVIKNLGKRMVFTSVAGLLPDMYEDTAYAKTNQTILPVQKDGLWGCIGLSGETVIPFVHKNALDVTWDGTMAFGRTTEGENILYLLADSAE